MSVTEVYADVYKQNMELLKNALADFSDADMVVRPCPGANHAAWQLGHLIVAETHFGNTVKPGIMPELPAGFSDKFNKSTTSIDDPKAFASKAELLSQFEKTRTGTIKWVRSLSPQDMEKPMPEQLQRFAKTVGHLAVVLPIHTTMHLGQIQVIRRKLGKPVLF